MVMSAGDERGRAVIMSVLLIGHGLLVLALLAWLGLRVRRELRCPDSEAPTQVLPRLTAASPTNGRHTPAPGGRR